MNLDKIGIELELNVGNYRQYYQNMSSSFLSKIQIDTQNTSRGNPEMGGFRILPSGIRVWLTDEYYSSQCEWKFYPEPLSKLPVLKKLMIDIVEATDWDIIHNEIPAFVGTHIHLFFKENKKEITKFVRGKTILSALLMEYFYYFFLETDIPQKVVRKELERLCFNHNILQKLDYKQLNKGIRTNLNKKGFDYYYTNMPKSKYQPVHWSNPNNGKPLTLELRFIPNAFFQFASVDTIHDFITTVEDKVGYINSLPYDDFLVEHEKNKTECIYWHSKLLDLYLEKMEGCSLSHLPVCGNTSSNNNQTTLENINLLKRYLAYRERWTSHDASFRYAKNDEKKLMISYLSQRSTDIPNEETLKTILNHIVLKNPTDFFEKCKQYIRQPLITFRIRSIKEITKKVPGLYTAVSCNIDEEGDEIWESTERSERPNTTYGNPLTDRIMNINMDYHNPSFSQTLYSPPNPQQQQWNIQQRQNSPQPTWTLSAEQIDTMIRSLQSTAPLSNDMATTVSLESAPF